MKKIFFVLISLLCLICVGCGNQTAEKKAATSSDNVVSIGLLPDTDSLPFLVAEEKGYFTAEGVKVKLNSFKSAMDRDAAMQSGNLDGAVSDMLAAAFAKDGGFDVKITSSTDGNYILVTAPAESVTTVQDIAGKEVAVSKNTIIEYVTDRILAQADMPEDSIKKVIIPQIPTRLEMLQNNQLSAATLPNPMATVALAGGCRKLASAEDLKINPGVMVFTGKAVDEKSKEIAAVYRAYNKAAEYLNTASRAEYVKLAIDKGGFPPAVENSLELPHYRLATMPDKNDFAACLEWLKNKNLIKQNYDYDAMTAVISPVQKP